MITLASAGARSAAKKMIRVNTERRRSPYREGFAGFGVCLIRLGDLGVYVSERERVKSEGKFVRSSRHTDLRRSCAEANPSNLAKPRRRTNAIKSYIVGPKRRGDESQPVMYFSDDFQGKQPAD